VEEIFAGFKESKKTGHTSGLTDWLTDWLLQPCVVTCGLQRFLFRSSTSSLVLSQGKPQFIPKPIYAFSIISQTYKFYQLSPKCCIFYQFLS
jgi:hypothetical protein